MISVIICSVNKSLLRQVSKSVSDTIGVEYEIIALDNSFNQFSLAQAYNLGAKQAKYEYLLFIHEDILFHTKDWGPLLIKHLKDPTIALVGVLGCTIKSKCPSGVWVPVEGVNRMNHLQGKPDGRTEKIYENPFDEPVSEVAVLDGMFLATRKEYWEQKPFDEDLLKGFHGYDIDFSLSQRALGKVVVIFDILIEHFSSGGNTREWIIAQLKVSEKWKIALPIAVAERLNAEDLKKVEETNLKILLLSLISNKLQLSIKIKYLWKLLLVSPKPFSQHFFIRKIFLGEFLDSIVAPSLRRIVKNSL